MPTVNVIWSFTGSTESYSATAGAATVASHVTSDGAYRNDYPTLHSLQMRITGASKSNPGNYWERAGITWESLGVPSGTLVTGVQGWYDWRCAEYTSGPPSSGNYTGPLEIRADDGTLIVTLHNAQSFNATSDWATRNGTLQSVPAAYQGSETPIRVRLANSLATGNDAAAAVTVRDDHIDLDLTYIVAIVGGSSTTNADDTLSASGTVVTLAASGSLSVTLAGDGLSGLGGLTAGGAGAATLADDSMAGAAGAEAGAAGAPEEAVDTLAAAAGVTVTGDGTLSAADDTLAAAGVVDTVISAGDLDAAAADDTLASGATVDVVGSTDAVLLDDTLTSVSTADVAGDAAIEAADDTLVAGSAIPVTAELGVDNADDTLLAAGVLDTITSDGDLVVLLGDDTLVGTVSVDVVGDLDVAAQDDTLAAVGGFETDVLGDAMIEPQGDRLLGVVDNIGVDIEVGALPEYVRTTPDWHVVVEDD